MGEILTIHAPLTDERREVLQGRLLLCIPISEAEAKVFGEGVDLLPALIEAAKAELAKLGGEREVGAQIDVAGAVALVIREACQRAFFAGALGAPDVGRVQ